MVDRWDGMEAVDGECSDVDCDESMGIEQFILNEYIEQLINSSVSCATTSRHLYNVHVNNVEGTRGEGGTIKRLKENSYYAAFRTALVPHPPPQKQSLPSNIVEPSTSHPASSSHRTSHPFGLQLPPPNVLHHPRAVYTAPCP